MKLYLHEMLKVLKVIIDEYICVGIGRSVVSDPL